MVQTHALKGVLVDPTAQLAGMCAHRSCVAEMLATLHPGSCTVFSSGRRLVGQLHMCFLPSVSACSKLAWRMPEVPLLSAGCRST